MIKIAFYKAQGLLSDRIIRFWTNGKYSHCELVLDYKEDDYSECYSSSMRDSGVRQKFIILDKDKWDLVDVDCDKILAKKWFDDHKGAKYSYLGLLSFVWRSDNYENNKYFCSEAVMSAIGFNEAWRFSPNSMKSVIDQILIKNKEIK
jgi:hypothetical protein